MRRALLTGLICMLTILSASSAHLTAGEDVTKDGYIIDFGYTPEHPETDDTVNFLLNLVNASTEERITPGSVWVRITNTNQEETLFTGEFSPRAGSITFSQRFSEPGNYEVTARFREADDTLVEHDFEVGVVGSSTSDGNSNDGSDQGSVPGILSQYEFGFGMFIVEIVLLVLIIIGIFVLDKKRKR